MGFLDPTPMFCANPDCHWHEEKRGGNFEMRDGKLYCAECIEMMRSAPVIGTSCKNLWDFTTTHFNGKPVHVQGLSHLRSLEKQYGCSSHIANHMESKWNQPPVRRG
jgi:hypothetical protein